MPEKNFFKDNLVLMVGLALPVLLMVGFMLAQAIPATVTDPPKHDMLFHTQDYAGNKSLPITAAFLVKDGELKVQYTKVAGQYPNTYWPKLYRYDAKTQQVSELAFGYPDDMDKIEGVRTDTVEATKGLKLSTNQVSSDGYEMTNENYRHRGLVNEILWDFGGRGGNEMRLRKGAASVKLSTSTGATFYYGNGTFIAWVVE
jgi:hypothetical protein